jgi:hypothetical protein
MGQNERKQSKTEPEKAREARKGIRVLVKPDTGSFLPDAANALSLVSVLERSQRSTRETEGGVRQGRGYAQRRARRLLAAGALVFLVLQARCGLPERKTCPEGQTCWSCTIQPTPCHMIYFTYPCAGNEQDAVAAANRDALRRLLPMDEIVGTTCTDTGSRTIRSQLVE